MFCTISNIDFIAVRYRVKNIYTDEIILRKTVQNENKKIYFLHDKFSVYRVNWEKVKKSSVQLSNRCNLLRKSISRFWQWNYINGRIFK